MIVLFPGLLPEEWQVPPLRVFTVVTLLRMYMQQDKVERFIGRSGGQMTMLSMRS
jgi:hypothetical protein